MLRTSHERVDALVGLSDRVYEAIDRPVRGEPRSRLMLRMGINVVAQTLETSYSHRLPGDYYHSLLVGQLADGGLSTFDPAYDRWPSYRSSTIDLPRFPLSRVDDDLADISNLYADVTRATITRDGSYETDADHAVHLSAIALPYAADIYPELDQAKIGIYCLVHDIVEAYAGDIPSLGISDELLEAKERAEQRALARLADELSTKYPRFINIIHAYERLSDDEARFVKTFDKLDTSFTHFANGGLSLTRDHGIQSGQEFLQQVGQTTRRMRLYAADYPEIMADREVLFERIIERTNWPQ